MVDGIRGGKPVKPPDTEESRDRTEWGEGGSRGAQELRQSGEAMSRTTETNPSLDALLGALFVPTSWSSKGRK